MPFARIAEGEIEEIGTGVFGQAFPKMLFSLDKAARVERDGSKEKVGGAEMRIELEQAARRRYAAAPFGDRHLLADFFLELFGWKQHRESLHASAARRLRYDETIP